MGRESLTQSLSELASGREEKSSLSSCSQGRGLERKTDSLNLVSAVGTVGSAYFAPTSPLEYRWWSCSRRRASRCAVLTCAARDREQQSDRLCERMSFFSLPFLSVFCVCVCVLG